MERNFFVKQGNLEQIIKFRGLITLRFLKKSCFTVETELKALNQVLSEFEVINQSWIPRKDWLQCQLALAEGFTNAVRHAHRDLAKNIPITIELTLTLDRMEIRIWDYGPPFDLDNFVNKSLKQKNIQGGQGIPILKKIASQLSYFRTNDNRNCLLIVKQFTTSIPDDN